ncbi:MAG: fibronectin type III domain-containing protein [Patescibacteria group bacterium]
MSVFKKTVVGVLAAGMLVPSLVFAQTSTSSVTALLEQIKALQAQIIALQQQQQTLVQQQQANVVALIRTLRQGTSGEDVKILQALLAADPSIYPEGMVSGFFGRLTAQAVKRFQKKHGFEQVGDVGPKTLKKLNELFGTIGSSTKSHDDDEGDDDDEDRDENDNRGSSSITVCHAPPGNPAARHTISVGGKAFIAHVRHGDTLGACSGGTGTTTPDTIAPTLSGISATNLTTSGATIVWTTNENSTSQVEYGTTTAYGATTTLDASLVTSHSVALTGLASSTLYHFRVLSKDAANNLATSGDTTFTTASPADTTAPIISGTSVSAIASTSATVSWTTNEAANSKVYYATTSPVDLGSALSVSNGTLVTSHSLGLTGLTASTTYYYVLESKDAANNTATTSTASFVTTI